MPLVDRQARPTWWWAGLGIIAPTLVGVVMIAVIMGF
jgi:hypothetical protein